MKGKARYRNKSFNPSYPTKQSSEINYRHLTLVFFIVFVLTTAPITAITIGFSYSLFWIAPIVGCICGYFIARENYHKMISLGLEEYNKQFRDNPAYQIKQYPYTEDSGCPMDPTSKNYWTLGPGSSNYDDR